MIHLSDIDSMYIDEQVAGFAKRMVEDGIVARQVDLLLIGFGYAVQQRLQPLEKIKRHDLLRAGALDPDSRLAIEATASWFARTMELPEPNDSRSLLDFICRVGSTGTIAIQTKSDGRAKNQIELLLLNLAQGEEQGRKAT